MGSLKRNWHPLSLALEKHPRLSRELSARPRSLLLLKERTERIKIVCLSWLTNCKRRSRHTSSRLKKLRRLLLSTWQSSARHSRSLRRLRKEPSWLWLCNLLRTSNHTNKEIKKFSKFKPSKYLPDPAYNMELIKKSS